jgi:hypothetical protein
MHSCMHMHVSVHKILMESESLCTGVRALQTSLFGLEFWLPCPIAVSPKMYSLSFRFLICKLWAKHNAHHRALCAPSTVTYTKIPSLPYTVGMHYLLTSQEYQTVLGSGLWEGDRD